MIEFTDEYINLMDILKYKPTYKLSAVYIY